MECKLDEDKGDRVSTLKYINQLLSENKLYSLNSTYTFCALKNLQFRFQETNLNLNRDSNLGPPDH